MLPETAAARQHRVDHLGLSPSHHGAKIRLLATPHASATCKQHPDITALSSDQLSKQDCFYREEVHADDYAVIGRDGLTVDPIDLGLASGIDTLALRIAVSGGKISLNLIEIVSGLLTVGKSRITNK
jgi:hypothetical protein